MLKLTPRAKFDYREQNEMEIDEIKFSGMKHNKINLFFYFWIFKIKIL
jgi:hypothetical protein